MSEIKTTAVDNRDGTISFNREQDVEGILQQNKEERNHYTQDKGSAIRKVASIPNIVIEQWLREGINIMNMGRCPDTRRKVLQKLNSPEFRYLRTHNSRI